MPECGRRARALRGVVCVALLALAGCTEQQVYQSAQGWRRTECQKLLDNAQRARCMAEADRDFQSYSRERQPDAR